MLEPLPAEIAIYRVLGQLPEHELTQGFCVCEIFSLTWHC